MEKKNINRRKFMSKTLAATTGAAIGLYSLEEQVLMAQMAKGTEQSQSQKKKAEENRIPTGQIGKIKISRLICGGNLITGWAHSRDLIYVSTLLKHYFTEEKIMDTLRLCEQNGINTIVVHTDKRAMQVLDKYWKQRGGRIQWIAQVLPVDFNDMTLIEWKIKTAIDNGAVGAFLEGSSAERCLQRGRIDLIERTLSIIRQNGIIAGVGGHSLRVPIECEAADLDLDFYVKTMHRDDYWSATPKEFRKDMNVDTREFFTNRDHNKDRDNIFCINPQEVIDFMAKVKKPWIAYKVLAAGAIHPKAGFDYAFGNGADFVLAGMFDFQVAQDAEIAINCVAKNQNRMRKWWA